jgi:hypothetical protein
MPIRPSQRALYPPDWKAISARIREREGNRCKWCGAENYQPHPRTGKRVVLTVAHLNHDERDCVDTNLAALCQGCHLRYDAKEHAKHAAETWRSRKACGDLFDKVK